LPQIAISNSLRVLGALIMRHTEACPPDRAPTFDVDHLLGVLQSRTRTIVKPEPAVALARMEQARASGHVLDRVAVRRLWHRRIVLGRFSAAHVGDTICTSSLARKLTEKYSCRVYVVMHRCTVRVFQNNPFVVGFLKSRGVRLGRLATGQGHLVHRLERFFGLPMSVCPRGEIYLSQEEIAWAKEFRAKLPNDRPVAVLSAGSITDSAWGRRGVRSWPELVDDLATVFTIVQPVVTRMETLCETIVNIRRPDQWIPETRLEGCHIIENPTFRCFLALLSIADLFVGQNSGGAHAAAALGIPAVIVLDRSRYSPEGLFRQHQKFWRNEDFLYPQHSFVLL
jgi:ADP-heptose:LPS heptosyltransferase